MFVFMMEDDYVMDTIRPLTDNAPMNLNKILVQNASTSKHTNNVAWRRITAIRQSLCFNLLIPTKDKKQTRQLV